MLPALVGPHHLPSHDGLHRLFGSHVNDDKARCTAAPAAINAETHLPYVTLPAGSVATVTVRLLYDDGTEDQVTFERNAVLLP